MKVDIREQRTDDLPLSRPRFTDQQSPIFDHADVDPFPTHFEESAAMRKWAKRIFGGLVILILTVVSAGAIFQWLTSRWEIAKNPAPGKLVNIGRYKLHRSTINTNVLGSFGPFFPVPHYNSVSFARFDGFERRG